MWGVHFCLILTMKWIFIKFFKHHEDALSSPWIVTCIEKTILIDLVFANVDTKYQHTLVSEMKHAMKWTCPFYTFAASYK